MMGGRSCRRSRWNAAAAQVTRFLFPSASAPTPASDMNEVASLVHSCAGVRSAPSPPPSLTHSPVSSTTHPVSTVSPDAHPSAITSLTMTVSPMARASRSTSARRRRHATCRVCGERWPHDALTVLLSDSQHLFILIIRTIGSQRNMRHTPSSHSESSITSLCLRRRSERVFQ